MSGEVQALFMVGAAGGEPPVTVCTPDPYYSCSASDTRTVLSIHADTDPPIDQSCYQTKTLVLTGSASISDVQSQFGGKSILVSNAGTSTLNGLAITDHDDFDFGTGDFTIDLWAYRSAETYIGTLFYGTLGGGEFSVKVLTNQIYLVYRSSGGQQAFNAVATWPTGEWVHFVLQRSGRHWETYLNGNLVHLFPITGGASSTVNSGGDLYFGRTNASSSQSWNGYLDDIRITKGVARYTPDVLPEYVIAWISAETLAPFSAEWQRTGATATTTGIGYSTTVKKCGSQSIQCQTAGSGYGFMTLTGSIKNIQPRTGDFCFEVWLYPTLAEFGVLCAHSNSGYSGLGGVLVQFNVNQTITGAQYNGTALVTSTTVLPLNAWSHVAVFRRSGVWAVAINGTIEATATNSADLNATGNVEFFGLDASPRQNYAFVGNADELRYCVGASPYSPSENFTPAACLYRPVFTPPLLTFCESADPVVVNPLPGEEPLQGVSATCALGTVKVAGSSTSLTSVSVTGAVGSIIPIAAGAPFPNLIIATTNLSGWSRNAPVVVHTNVKKDGTVSWELYDGSTETQPVLSGNIGLWIVNTDPNYPIDTIIDRYTFSAFRNGEYGGSFSVVSSPDANTILRVVTSVSTEVNPILFDFEITVLPTNSNPRFGESGYYGRNRILYSLAQPAPVSPSAYPNLISTTYGPSTFTASVPATAYLDFMADGRVLFFSLAANTIPDFEGRWIQTSTYYNTQDILSAYSFSSTHWNILTPGGGVWKRVRIDYGLNTTFVQTIVPNSTNPRYNEAGYIGTHTFTLQLVGLT